MYQHEKVRIQLNIFHQGNPLFHRQGSELKINQIKKLGHFFCQGVIVTEFCLIRNLNLKLSKKWTIFSVVIQSPVLNNIRLLVTTNLSILKIQKIQKNKKQKNYRQNTIITKRNFTLSTVKKFLLTQWLVEKGNTNCHSGWSHKNLWLAVILRLYRHIIIRLY